MAQPGDHAQAVSRRGHAVLAQQPDSLYLLVDAGTVELVEKLWQGNGQLGDLVARFEAHGRPEQIESHFAARDAIDRIIPEAFKEIGRRVRMAADRV